MSRLHIRAAEPGDLDALLDNVRPADVAECDALVGPGKLRETVEQSIEQSVLTWAAEVPDRGLMCLFGLSPVSMLGGQGLPWMVGTWLVDRHAGAFIRASRPYIAKMLGVCPQLLNLVDARNVKSIAYLERMGFTILPAQPAGVSGLPFHPFFRDA